ncbi:uncharacterized protein LOC132061094 [Lycium ferocissimum]|uniref:uncharacterized protein LOC132061094 n=1 Tax=Lycium ferocissimum TaxID=112874 RepID=UPI0028155CA9|nr:uncharacterized protein LOC132061094 [Lycium ferocissimum]
MEEMPCLHAWAILKSKNLKADNYYSNLYKSETVVKTYDVPVYPLPDESKWKIPASISEEIVLPPRYKRPPGRPKKKRDKPLTELLPKKRSNSCCRCGHEGHNRRSCRNEPTRK